MAIKSLLNANILNKFWQDMRDLILLFPGAREALNKGCDCVIERGVLKVILSSCGIKIAWKDREVLHGIGFSVVINTLGIWTDSSKARWLMIDEGMDGFQIKVIFQDLPLCQIWDIKIENENRISWQIYSEIEENLCINEIRVSCFLNPYYRFWSDLYESGCFPYPADNSWQDIYLGSAFSNLVGAKLSFVDKLLPAFVLELNAGGNPRNLFSYVQNAPINLKSRLVGFRNEFHHDKINYSAGRHHLLSCAINILPEEELENSGDTIRQLWKDLDRDSMLKKAHDKKLKPGLTILLANLPWQTDGKYGVRAGSRWPHLKDNSEVGYTPFPFFLAYAAALLEKNSINTSIIDAIVDKIDERDFIANILPRDMDYLIAETSVPSLDNDLRILKKIEKFGISIILCGPCTYIYNPEFLEEHSFIDFILYGEYEYTLRELLLALKNNVKLSNITGLIYRDGSNVIRNPPRSLSDINLLPWPHRDTLPMEKYIDMPGRIPYPSVQMLASRGCPFGCSFCLWPQVMYQGFNYRPRDPQDVVAEMEFLVRERKFRSVYFDDDTFNIGKERMFKFCNLLKERGLENVPWAIMARADLMDKEILIKMKDSGLCGVKYGIESFNNALLKGCNKNLELEKATQMIKLTKDLGVGVHLTFTFGLDGETMETALRTIDYALALDPDSLQFSLLTPFPGTQLFEDLDAQGRILTRDWSLYDGNYNCVFKPIGINSEELIGLKRQAYILWEKHKRRKMGVKGHLEKFLTYLNKYGFSHTVRQVAAYLELICVRKKRLAGYML